MAGRFVHNDRLINALMTQAFSALNSSPGAPAYYDQQRSRGVEHNAALRQLANRLVGILHGCLKTRTFYDETRRRSQAELQDEIDTESKAVPHPRPGPAAPV